MGILGKNAPPPPMWGKALCPYVFLTSFELVVWYARLLHIGLCILQFLFGENRSRIGKDTVNLNNVQLIINEWSLIGTIHFRPACKKAHMVEIKLN